MDDLPSLPAKPYVSRLPRSDLKVCALGLGWETLTRDCGLGLEQNGVD